FRSGAVTVMVVGAPPVDPVLRIGIAEHLVGHRREGPRLGHHVADADGQDANSDKCHTHPAGCAMPHALVSSSTDRNVAIDLGHRCAHHSIGTSQARISPSGLFSLCTLT